MSGPLKISKKISEKVAEITSPLPKDTQIEIWFQDEARVGQKNRLVHQWAKKGTRPRQPADQRYESVYIFGAVCPELDKGAALIMPRADTEAMQHHLEEISKNVAPGAHAVVVMDGAAWHRSRDLEWPQNISPLILPPYCPELNPVENIWQFLRNNYLSRRLFETCEEIIDTCCNAWNRLIAETGRITSITKREWAIVKGV